MFKNLGKKIKTLAKIACWIKIIFVVVFGIVLMMANLTPLGNLTEANSTIPTNLTETASTIQRILWILTIVIGIVIGVLLSWISSFKLYGFGVLVENSDIRTELAVKEAGKKRSAE